VEKENLDAAGHRWKYVIDTEAGCTTEGSKSIHCSNCDAQILSTVIPAKGHSYVDGRCEVCKEEDPRAAAEADAAWLLMQKKKTSKLVWAKKTAKATRTIPMKVTLNGVKCKVTEIGDKAFYGCKNLKQVVVKTSKLKTIKGGAFRKTSKKKTVTFKVKKMTKQKKTALMKKNHLKLYRTLQVVYNVDNLAKIIYLLRNARENPYEEK